MVEKFKRVVNEKRLNTQSYLRKIRLRLVTDKSTVDHLKVTLNCEKKWYGSSYGGFFINPRLLHEKSVVYSFGIGRDITFDKKVMAKHKCHVFGFDPTPKSINYIKTTTTNNLFHFYEFGISTKTGVERFFLPVNPKGVSASMILNETVGEENGIEVQMKKFADIARELGHQKVDVLKIDIEGAEYDVLEDILTSDVVITQLLVEFHDRLFKGEIKSKKIVELLNKNGFEVFGASLNHEEISFINTKLL
ncbi:MAG: FkbM family methyltransferase [Bacteroidia bacterium]